MVGYTLVVKAYLEDIVAFMGLREVARHKRLPGPGGYSVDIFHYLDTLARKPGAVEDSVALRFKDAPEGLSSTKGTQTALKTSSHCLQSTQTALLTRSPTV